VSDEAIHKELGDSMEMAVTTTSSLEPEQDSDAQTRFETTSKCPVDPLSLEVNTWKWTRTATQDGGVDSGIPTDSQQTPITTQPTSSRPQKKQSRKKQRKETGVPQDETHHDDSVHIPSNDPLLSGKDRMQLTELMILRTNLQKQVLDLEKAKDAQAKEIVGLKKRVQKLESKKKSRTTRLQRLGKVGESRRVESFKDKDSLDAQEDASNQRRSFKYIDKDTKVSLVDEIQGRTNNAEMFDTYDLRGDEVIVNI
ncbi:hypothetical protein Tco_1141135, partial [Tanacetum coccineum]